MKNINLLCLLIILTTPLFCFISFYFSPYEIPIFCIIPSYFPLLILMKNRKIKLAIFYMLFWASLLAASMTWLIYKNPHVAKDKILYGEQYKKEMLIWAKTGVGKESSPNIFIPFHFIELIAFSTLSLLTASLFSVIMGAFLMNFMSYYVASLAIEGKNQFLLILGWHPWAIIRIISFVILGVIFSDLLLSKIFHFNFSFKEHKNLLKLALLLWFIHVLMKIFLSRFWQSIIFSNMR